MTKSNEILSMAPSTTLRVAKRELRNLIKQKLSCVAPESIHSQSSDVFKQVISFKPYQKAKRIGIYLSMPTGELQTDAIVRHALGNGKQVFVPYLFRVLNPPPDTPKSVMDMVDLKDLPDYESLKRDSWGIPAIEPETVGEREHVLGEGSQPLDMILMPGVAFDTDSESGFIRRLGHGKGFYDYFLNRYRGIHGPEKGKGLETDLLLYALALEEQLVESGSSVPIGEHDNLLHGLFTAGGIVEGPLAR